MFIWVFAPSYKPIGAGVVVALDRVALAVLDEPAESLTHEVGNLSSPCLSAGETVSLGEKVERYHLVNCRPYVVTSAPSVLNFESVVNEAEWEYTTVTMFGTFWHDFLYQPLFNLLIYVYSNWTNFNFGWAVIYVTILLRLALLPFTLVTERDKIKNQELAAEIHRVEKQFHNDQVIKKDEIRKILRKRKVHPWAKIVVLGMQLLVLILLYQVFLRGITGEKILKILYPSIDFPGKINTMFYGFDLGEPHNILWAGLVWIFLFGEIYLDYRKSKPKLRKSDLLYFIFFPTGVALLLYMLPMVKSLFVLTSMVFSVIIYQFSKMLFKDKPKPTAAAHH
ncbi:MAG TPA: YidC/Oxa1 family membrane protein insertase [Candidatus Kapabacteria bacterium]|nr:YidC/Oxa1 family membrane protein insertase [Candidatus Kapabacteria bacterium]